MKRRKRKDLEIPSVEERSRFVTLEPIFDRLRLLDTITLRFSNLKDAMTMRRKLKHFARYYQRPIYLQIMRSLTGEYLLFVMHSKPRNDRLPPFELCPPPLLYPFKKSFILDRILLAQKPEIFAIALEDKDFNKVHQFLKRLRKRYPHIEIKTAYLLDRIFIAVKPNLGAPAPAPNAQDPHPAPPGLP